MEFPISWMKNLRDYRAVRAAVQDEKLPAAATGLSHIHKALLIASLSRDLNRKGLVVTADESEAVRLSEDLAAFGIRALIYPYRDFTFRSIAVKSHEYEHIRIGTLSNMLEGDYDIVLASVSGATQYTIPPHELFTRSFTLTAGDAISIDEAVSRLISAGYSRFEQVEGAGQFALRGGILDVLPPHSQYPVRIEFWGDEIDSLAEFEVESQRRRENLKSVKITPAEEVLFGSYDELADRLEKLLNSKKKLSEKSREKIYDDIDALRAGLPVATDKYLPLVYDRPATLFDYAENALLFVSDTTKIKDKMKNILWQHGEDITSLLSEGYIYSADCKFCLDSADLAGVFENGGAVYMETFPGGGYDTKIRSLTGFNLKQFSLWSGSLEILMEDLNTAGKNHVSVVLAGGEKAAEVLTAELQRNGIKAVFAEKADFGSPDGVYVCPGGLSAGFDIPELGFTVISQGRSAVKMTRYKGKRKDAKEIGSIEELKNGDYVVHSAHGIGIFEGIEQLSAGGVTKDYIKIRYAGKDVLYLPVTQLDLVSKYIGAATEEGHIRLHKLGGEQWIKTKTRVKKTVKNMAKELIALYAKRMSEPGIAFSPDTDMQNDFERRFEYEETEDQLRCINEIKSDMERAVPMDRLLCGDVGFGKTEVALRAAFKCIAEGKQCALLVPTTILAWQHYQTALRRMAGFPIQIELLSRFRTAAQQGETIKGLRRGNVDMVIGTHRMISKDVIFKDLGLVIIDEEQRFGVAQKEKLKELHPKVDVLTLSATPIPRTLNMAMSGLRDMSSIDEAPGDRHPVQTYVLEQDNGILADAINKELRRGGQIYYLHNRVESIEATASRLSILIPDCRIAVAHGQMGEEELSRVWERLLEHEIDLLVCTTIIETGVDVPNANTLIIEDADRMGLSQLHQLRGRVGRSSRRAYAYLCYRQGKALSDIATKRLEAVREYTEFGSGFKIAMRDLEIRGAGDILGGEQHGQMEAVGYDMYLKLLSDAVNEEKGLEVALENECTIDLSITAHIPEKYIPTLSHRLGIYRRIADIRTPDDADDVMDELIDRFGEPPAAVLGLIDVSTLRNRAAAHGIYEISQRDKNMLMYLGKVNDAAGKVCSKLKGRAMLNAGQKPYISIRMTTGQEPLDALNEALDIMDE